MSGWTPELDSKLRSLYRLKTHEEIGALIGKSRSAVRNRCWRLRLQKKADFWTDEEVAVLRDWYTEHKGKAMDLDALAEKLGRPRTSVCKKAGDLGLTNNKRPMSEDQRATMSVTQKRWLQENEHPRGFGGHKHGEESRRKMSAASLAHQAIVTPEEIRARVDKAIRTKIERYGTGGGARTSGNPFSRTKSGKRPDLNDQFFRSRWEANYARFLNFLIRQGKIDRWEYEPDTFVFHGMVRGAISYTPDFKVFALDGSYEYHEVKGWMDGPSKTRLKRMAKFYPDEKVVVIGQKEYTQLERTIAGAIPNWEIPKPKFGRAA